ncbi:MAG: type I-E CRISPR-associated protein Cas7/Cse4/CasC [Desulfovibrionaceae bacterium]|nr:type I-E CRISPR-associated protein Cas7/Cse4/CasC [Desulfovibrionaceae bacterium]
MSRFIQLHVLTSYPAANLNRDDAGSPKSMQLGNTTRLRVSSQSLKRAWRTSDVFKKALGAAGHLGWRTKELGRKVHAALTQGATLETVWDDPAATGDLPKLSDAKALEIGRAVAAAFGKLKPEPKKGKKGKDSPEDANALADANPAEGAAAAKKSKDADPETARTAVLESLEIEQLAHVSPEERQAVSVLTEACRASGKAPAKEALDLLRHGVSAADIAMFGRMIAANARFNVEAAVQVAHAMTVHKAAPEDDFFTAVDDLNKDDSGAGHMGVAEFGAGVFYLYLCVDRELLAENLGGDEKLAAASLAALVEAVCTVSPTGKQNSFGSRAYAFFALAEKGDEQPRNLSLAFLKPVSGENVAEKSVEILEDSKKKMDTVYGQKIDARKFNALNGTGSIDELVTFVRG